jgi:hypothetical protein
LQKSSFFALSEKKCACARKKTDKMRICAKKQKGIEK